MGGNGGIGGNGEECGLWWAVIVQVTRRDGWVVWGMYVSGVGDVHSRSVYVAEVRGCTWQGCKGERGKGVWEMYVAGERGMCTWLPTS